MEFEPPADVVSGPRNEFLLKGRSFVKNLNDVEYDNDSAPGEFNIIIGCREFRPRRRGHTSVLNRQ